MRISKGTFKVTNLSQIVSKIVEKKRVPHTPQLQTKLHFSHSNEFKSLIRKINKIIILLNEK
jgi:hypothetical protein